MVEWKQTSLPGVEVSSDGHLRSGGRITRGYTSNTGYYIWCAHGKNYYVHRLVAEAFCERPEGATVVNHLDGDRHNNEASNLEWTTHKGNCAHASRTGALNVPHRQGPVTAMRLSDRRVWVFDSQTQAALVLNLKSQNVSAACSGKLKTYGGYVFAYGG